MLGHKSLKSAEICINIGYFLFEAGANDQFTVCVVEKSEEIKGLLEVGFEYVCQKDVLIFLKEKKMVAKLSISSRRRLLKSDWGGVSSLI